MAFHHPAYPPCDQGIHRLSYLPWKGPGGTALIWAGTLALSPAAMPIRLVRAAAEEKKQTTEKKTHTEGKSKQQEGQTQTTKTPLRSAHLFLSAVRIRTDFLDFLRLLGLFLHFLYFLRFLIFFTYVLSCRVVYVSVYVVCVPTSVCGPVSVDVLYASLVSVCARVRACACVCDLGFLLRS